MNFNKSSYSMPKRDLKLIIVFETGHGDLFRTKENEKSFSYFNKPKFNRCCFGYFTNFNFEHHNEPNPFEKNVLTCSSHFPNIKNIYLKVSAVPTDYLQFTSNNVKNKNRTVLFFDLTLLPIIANLKKKINLSWNKDNQINIYFNKIFLFNGMANRINFCLFPMRILFFLRI